MSEIMELARVVPSFEGGDSGEVGNYRPISVLPATSKLLDRLVANILIRFLNTFNLFVRTSIWFT